MALGSYRKSPFVTGHNSASNDNAGLKTEILNYESQEWEEADDYPLPNDYPGYRMYVSSRILWKVIKSS